MKKKRSPIGIGSNQRPTPAPSPRPTPPPPPRRKFVTVSVMGDKEFDRELNLQAEMGYRLVKADLPSNDNGYRWTALMSL